MTQPIPQMITTTAALEAFCAGITPPYVALDTEFVRERTYYPHLCLVQLATPQHLALIDVQAPALDIAPLMALLMREDIVKVLHAGRQDIEIFWHLGRCIPKPLVDTQITAMALGHPDNWAYSAMVQHYLGVTVDKSQQYTQWDRRPLSPAQCSYAAADVTHLCAVYERMMEEVAAMGRSQWPDSVLGRLQDPATYEARPEDAWKRLWQEKMQPRSLAALQHLCAWREREAQSRNLPRRFLMADEALQAVALYLPKDAEALAQIRAAKGLSAIGREAALAAIAHARALPDDLLPPRMKSSRAKVSAALLQLLSMLLKARAEEANVAAELVGTRSDLEQMLCGEETTLTQGWRHTVFGQYAQDLLAGRLTLRVKAGKIVFDMPEVQ